MSMAQLLLSMVVGWAGNEEVWPWNWENEA
jgi:hypothetical protein